MTETDKTYNGWTNYETWNVKLWMDNDEGSYNHYREVARGAWENAEATTPSQLTREEVAARDLADLLKDEFEEGKDDLLKAAKLSSSVWADLLGAALSEVNWDEIASSMIEDIDKE